MWRFLLLLIFICLSVAFYILTAKKEKFTTSIEVNILNEAISEKNVSDDGKVAKNDRKVKTHVPKYMLDLYERSRKNRQDNLYPDIVRSVIPRSAGPFYNKNFPHTFHDNHLLIFDVPSSKVGEEFLKAELKILINVESTIKPGLESIIKISVVDDNTQKQYFVQKLQVYHSNDTWISFNLTSEVQNVLTQNERYLKVVISIKSFLPHLRNFKLSLLPVKEDFDHDYPILVLFYSNKNGEDKNLKLKNRGRSNSHKFLNNEMFNRSQNKHEELNNFDGSITLPDDGLIRAKRNIEEDYEEDNRILGETTKKIRQKLRRIRNTCRRVPLYVDFSAINYDSWIIEPRGYEAFQCQGKCFYPVAEHLSPTKHAIIQALLHNIQPAKTSRPCCVPTGLESMSVIYIDDRGFLTYMYAYKDMVVAECGCR